MKIQVIQNGGTDHPKITEYVPRNYPCVPTQSDMDNFHTYMWKKYPFIANAKLKEG